VDRPPGEEIRTDKDIDKVLALAFACLAAYSLYGALTIDGLLLRIEVAASVPLNAFPALFFWIREPSREDTRRGEIFIPAISLIIPFFALNTPSLFPAPYSISFGFYIAMAGAGLAISSFVHLQRSFAIMPAVRSVVTSGPYRVVRHPLYLGELTYTIGMVMLGFNVLSVVLIILSVVVLVMRVNIEERKLLRYPEYADYARKVRYRMVPPLF
jgi:protein-S-isoprenylcysteine O-methyltransferase Ste14